MVEIEKLNKTIENTNRGIIKDLEDSNDKSEEQDDD